MKLAIFLVMALLAAGSAGAKVVTQAVEYKQGEAVLEGYLAYDDAKEGIRPGILVIHDWTGINDYTRGRVEQLAGMGYIAFAADIYGKGVRPQTAAEASKQASIYRSDRALMRARANAALQVLRDHELSDDENLAAIGYCFGGGTALELARSGADLEGVVSFHGNLDTPDPSIAQNIKCKLLVCHGALDPHVPMEQVRAFMDEMNAAKVDYQIIIYSGAVHSFTKPSAGDDPSTGAAYNYAADHRSWGHMRQFFKELFNNTP